MNKVEIKNFIANLKTTLYTAGELATKKQGLVMNIEKSINALDRDNDYVKLRRSAKTEVDEEVQELILSVSSKLLNSKKIFLDAEEDTPSKKYFPIIQIILR